MRIPACCLIAVFFILPVPAYAAVLINEVAWMGTVASANDEWIELFNSGPETVDLKGWKVEGQDGTPSIALTGIIPAGSYFILERSNDDTVPEAKADAIFSGAIGNENEVLILKDPVGSTIDSVDGSGSWKIGGNKTSKETLQRTAGGWITAVGTPRRQNADPPKPAQKAPPIATASMPTKTISSANTANPSSSKKTSISKSKSESIHKPDTSAPSEKPESSKKSPQNVAAVSESGLTSLLPWILGLLALMGTAIAGVLVVKRNPEDEYTITE